MSDAINNAAIDAILDGTLDDIADLPSFDAWPSGTYLVQLPAGFATKEINSKPAMELKMKLVEVVELGNAAEQAEQPKTGDETSLSFMMDNDTGKGFFKEAIKPFVEHLGLSVSQPGAIRAAVDSAKGMTVAVTLKRRSYTKDGEQRTGQNLVSVLIS